MATQPLSLEEFRARYRQHKPYFEYWFGEPIQKPKATWLHAVLQGIVGEALRRAGYKSGSEVERLAWQWKSGSLEAITQMLLPNGNAVALEEIWRQLEEQA